MFFRPPAKTLHAKIHAGKWVEAPKARGTAESTTIQRLRQFGAKITRKNGVVTEILLGNSPITDADMSGIESIDSLESLTVFGCMNITDVTFARLKKFPHLKVLNIAPSNITDAGVENLKGLKDLWFLSLNGTQVTDAGLKHLIDNSKIRVLYLNGAKVTDQGLVFLEQMQDMQSLELSNTSIGDAGLIHLAKLPKLQNLQVLNTKVTQKGIDALKRALPNVTIRQNKLAAPPAVADSNYGQAAGLMRWSIWAAVK